MAKLKLPEWTKHDAPVLRALPGVNRMIGCNIRRTITPVNLMKVWTHYNGFLIVRGEMDYADWTGKTWKLGPGDFGQHLPGKRHEIVRHGIEDFCECSISLSHDLYEAMVNLDVINPAVPVLRLGLSLPLLERFHKCNESLAQARDDQLVKEAYELQGLLLRIRELARECAADPIDMYIDEAKWELGQNFREEFNLPALVERFPLSYYHFRRIFKERTGMAPGRFRVLKKMEAAELYLSEGELNVDQVAEMLGYSDRFVFSKQFKKVVGLSPGEYMNRRSKG